MSRDDSHPTAFSNRDRSAPRPTPARRSDRGRPAALDHIVGRRAASSTVGIATREPEDPLPHQFQRLMLHLARLAPIDQTPGQALGQLQLGIEAFQQHRPAVRAGVRHVEGRDDRLRFGLESEPVDTSNPAIGGQGKTGHRGGRSSRVCCSAFLPREQAACERGVRRRRGGAGVRDDRVRPVSGDTRIAPPSRSWRQGQGGASFSRARGSDAWRRPAGGCASCAGRR